MVLFGLMLTGCGGGSSSSGSTDEDVVLDAYVAKMLGDWTCSELNSEYDMYRTGYADGQYYAEGRSNRNLVTLGIYDSDDREYLLGEMDSTGAALMYIFDEVSSYITATVALINPDGSVEGAAIVNLTFSKKKVNKSNIDKTELRNLIKSNRNNINNEDKEKIENAYKKIKTRFNLK